MATNVLTSTDLANPVRYCLNPEIELQTIYQGKKFFLELTTYLNILHHSNPRTILQLSGLFTSKPHQQGPYFPTTQIASRKHTTQRMYLYQQETQRNHQPTHFRMMKSHCCLCGNHQSCQIPSPKFPNWLPYITGFSCMGTNDGLYTTRYTWTPHNMYSSFDLPLPHLES